jgi:hypothetical protein
MSITYQAANFHSWSQITVRLQKLGVNMHGHNVVILHSTKVTVFNVFHSPADKMLGPWIPQNSAIHTTTIPMLGIDNTFADRELKTIKLIQLCMRFCSFQYS